MFQTILINPLFNILALIYGLLPGHDFGLAVIILTVLLRLLLWPLVNRQLHSQKALQALQPEMAKIKQKTKGDRQKETQMIMELYKERGISPFASFVPVLIQLPIFIGLYIVLRDFVQPGQIAHLTYAPLRGLPAIKDIIAGGAFKPSLLGLVDLTKPSIVLAVLAAGAQFYATKQLMPNKTAPGQPNMNFTMYLFPLLTLFIALKLPAALSLYWTVTSAVAVYQQHLVLGRDVEELEDAKGAQGGKK